MYYLINGLIVLAMMFFFLLPMTDDRTARLKLCVVCALAVALTVSATSIRTQLPAPIVVSSR